jgi:hypothetical protein
MNLVVESQYFPVSILFKKSIEILNIKIDEYEPWRKMSFRNRCVVAGANGPINLSIPVLEGREQKKAMNEVAIDNRKPWQAQHWKTITSCYNRSPWFDFFSHELEEIYRQRFELLIDWNRTCFEWVNRVLGKQLRVEYIQTKYDVKEGANEVDWRNKLVPKTILQEFPRPVRYRQVFEERTGFIPHLSILDLLFCEGRNARAILSKNDL